MESLRADHVLNVIGVIGGSAISVSLLPQVIHTYKTKCTADISYSYQLIYIFGTALVNTYAIYYGYWAVYAPCLLEFILIVTLTIMKGIYDKRGVVADVVLRRDSATSSYHSRSMRRSSIIHAGTTSSTNRHGGSSGALALDILSDIQLSLSTLYQTEIDLDDEKTCADILEMAYSMEEGLKKVISDAAQAKKQTFTTEDLIVESC